MNSHFSRRFAQVLRRLSRRTYLRARTEVLFGIRAPWIAPRSRQRLARSYREHEISLLLKKSSFLVQGQIDSLYIHIPKTGGTSIKQALGESAGFIDLETQLREGHSIPPNSRLSLNHLDLRMLIQKRVLSVDSLQESFIFTMVRNPYDRATSLFRYFKTIGRIPPNIEFLRFLKLVRLSKPSPGLFKVARLSQAAPQSTWLPEGLTQIPTHIFQLENLYSATREVENKLNTKLKIPHLNRSRNSSAQICWTSAAVEEVRSYYLEDFLRFGYDPDVPTRSKASG